MGSWWYFQEVELHRSLECSNSLIYFVFAASTITRWFTYLTFPCWSKRILSNPVYVMDSLMEMEDWALACSWPPAGDQWQYSVDQFFEPVHLLDNKSDEAEYQPFNDDVTVQQNQSFNTVWSSGSSCMFVIHLQCSTSFLFYTQFADLSEIWSCCACFLGIYSYINKLGYLFQFFN